MSKISLPIPNQKTALAAAVIIITVVSIWLPFGLRSTIGQHEEWYAVGQILRGQNFFFVADTPTRPMLYSPNALLYLLDPGSFVGFNLVYIALFIGKGLLIYAIMRRLVPQQPFIALVAGVLAIIYPVDEGLLSFRAINVHVTLVFGLLALYLFLLQSAKPRRWLWPVIGILQVLTLLIYEVLYIPFFAVPLLLLWLAGRFSWRVVRLSALWLLIPLALFAQVAVYLAGEVSGSYLASVVNSAAGGEYTTLSALTANTLRMYQRHISEWGGALQFSPRQPAFLLLAGGVGLLVSLVAWLHLSEPVALRQRWKTYPILILGGAGLMAAGFAAFLPSPIQAQNWRVFFVTSVGAAVIAAAGVHLLRVLPFIGRGLAALVTGALVTLALVYSLHQHQYFVRSSAVVMELFGSIIAQAPAVDDTAHILVLDPNNTYVSEWRLAGNNWVLTGGLQTLYEKPIEAQICPQIFFPHDPGKQCEFRAEGVYTETYGIKKTIPYEKLILFENLPDGRIELLPTIPERYTREPGAVTYNPMRLIDSTAPIPPRAYTLFPCWPLRACLPLPFDDTPTDTQRIEFDWLVPGTGWRPHHIGADTLWTHKNPATLLIYPTTEQDLSVRMGIRYANPPALLDALRIEVNRSYVRLERTFEGGLHVFSGVIPRAALLPTTEIRFIIGQAVEFEYILEFDWLEIQPAQNTAP